MKKGRGKAPTKEKTKLQKSDLADRNKRINKRIRCCFFVLEIDSLNIFEPAYHKISNRYIKG